MAMQFSLNNTMSLNNSNSDVQNCLIGHMLTLKSEKEECEKSLTKIKDPADGTSDLPIIGPIVDWHWDHIAGNPITISGVTDQDNNGVLLSCLAKTDSSLHFQIQFTIYRYDLNSKKWVKFYDVESPLKATLTPGGVRNVEPNPIAGQENPKLFPYTLAFSPDGVGQIIYTPKDGKKIVLTWGTNG